MKNKLRIPQNKSKFWAGNAAASTPSQCVLLEAHKACAFPPGNVTRPHSGPKTCRSVIVDMAGECKQSTYADYKHSI